jgi:hypothetical protein
MGFKCRKMEDEHHMGARNSRRGSQRPQCVGDRWRWCRRSRCVKNGGGFRHFNNVVSWVPVPGNRKKTTEAFGADVPRLSLIIPCVPVATPSFPAPPARLTDD